MLRAFDVGEIVFDSDSPPTTFGNRPMQCRMRFTNGRGCQTSWTTFRFAAHVGAESTGTKHKVCVWLFAGMLNAMQGSSKCMMVAQLMLP